MFSYYDRLREKLLGKINFEYSFNGRNKTNLQQEKKAVITDVSKEEEMEENSEATDIRFRNNASVEKIVDDISATAAASNKRFANSCLY